MQVNGHFSIDLIGWMIIKPTIHEATFVGGDTATLLFVRAVHEISNATVYKLLENGQPVYFQVTCRMYHAIFLCAARMNNNVAVSPATKVASCMVGLTLSTQTCNLFSSSTGTPEGVQVWNGTPSSSTLWVTVIYWSTFSSEWGLQLHYMYTFCNK